MKTETIMPRFRSYRPIKPDWKYEKKCCKECGKEYLTDNMMGAYLEGKVYTWFCIRCYNLSKQS